MRRAEVPPALGSTPFTRAMALACGLSAKQLRSAAYRRLLHEVYVDAAVPDSVELRAGAVRLVLPDDAVVGYTAAAWLHGADVRDRRMLDVEVIAQRGDQLRRAGIAATSALLEPADITEVLGVPVTTPTRTAFDRTVDAALTHAEPLSESPMETRQRMRLVLAGLPRPRAQTPVTDANGRVFAYIDNGYEQYRVGADYDGEYHGEQWRHDLERQERIRDRGWWHRRFTSLHIGSHWPAMVDHVGRALQAAGWSG